MRIRLENSELSRKEMLPAPKEFDKVLVNKTEDHLEIIKDSLRDFVKRIQDEKPDMVVFLDKSARVFGEPIFKYLAEQKLPQMPEIKFYNDDYLKNLYLGGKLNKEAVDKELFCLKNKKVFFLDETFSSGKGAATIKKVKEFLSNSEIFYFALTEDRSPKVLDDFEAWFDLPEEEHRKNLNEINQDSRFKVYNNDIGELFSREASRLYVSETEENGKGQTIIKPTHAYLEKVKIGEKEILMDRVHNSDKYNEYPCGKEEYFKLKEKEKQNTVRIIKQKILEKLRSGE